MPKISRQRLAARRRGILRAAARCLARQGLSATGMRDIFRASNLSPGAVYRYFRGKTDLIAAVAAEAPLTAEAALAVADEQEDGQTLPAILTAASGAGEAARLELGLRAAALEDGQLRRTLAERRRQAVARLAGNEAVRRGAVRLGWPAERLARLLLQLGDGLWLAAALDPAAAGDESAADAVRLIEAAAGTGGARDIG